jgi:hypothetical protein
LPCHNLCVVGKGLIANIVVDRCSVKVPEKEAADRTYLTAGLAYATLPTHVSNRVTRQHLELQKGAGGLEFSEILIPPGLEATIGSSCRIGEDEGPESGKFVK